MVRIYGYNAEIKEKGFADLYIIAILSGIFIAVILVVGSKGIIFLARFFIEKWVWAVGVVFAIVLIKIFLARRRRR